MKDLKDLTVKAFLLQYLSGIHWKRFGALIGGTFVLSFGAHLVANPAQSMTFRALGQQAEGATCAGLLAIPPVLGAALINIYKGKRALPGDDQPDYDSVEHDPLDEAIPPK